MITMTVQCPHCGSDALVRHGRASNGKQKYLCRACPSPFQDSKAIESY